MYLVISLVTYHDIAAVNPWWDAIAELAPWWIITPHTVSLIDSNTPYTYHTPTTTNTTLLHLVMTLIILM